MGLKILSLHNVYITDEEEEATVIVSPKTGEGNQAGWLLTVAGLLAGMSAILLGKQRKEVEE